MASLKIKHRHSSIEGKAGTLFDQVIHTRVARHINSGYNIYPDEWDIFNSQITIPAKTGENRHRYLVCLLYTSIYPCSCWSYAHPYTYIQFHFPMNSFIILTAVSYTHLDVYKRQNLCRSSTRCSNV